jgi:hypothetical protein
MGPGSLLSVNGGVSIGTAYAAAAVAPTDGLIVAGNIGIGTSAPVERLHLHNSTGNVYLKFTSNSTANGSTIGLNGVSLQFQNADPGYGSPIYFYNNATLAMAMNSGQVGIGTASPGAILEVVGAGTTSATASLIVRDSTKAAKVTVLDNGNVGIGTASPQALLDLAQNTSGNASENITNINSGTVAYAELNVANQSESSGNGSGMRVLAMSTGLSTNGAYVQDAGVLESGGDLSNGLSIMTRQGDMRFYTGGLHNEWMRILSTGNVGIGSSAPTQALDVVGTVKATAFIGDGSGLTGVSAGGWSRSAPNVYLTTSSDNVGIGASPLT